MKLKHIVILITLILSMNFAQYHIRTEAQGEDCGNGLIQQLSVGVTGWVIPEPPIPVNVRNMPGGNIAGQLQPGDTFTVIDGPECNQTYSWWQVSGESVMGWIAEGVEADSYFVEPLPMVEEMSDAIINANPDCSEALPSRIHVGNMVEVVEGSGRDFDLYYGHPAIENALFSGTRLNRMINASSNVSLYLQSTQLVDLKFKLPSINTWVGLVTDGPYCFNGQLLWRIGTLSDISDSTYDLYSHYPYIFNEQSYWIAEANDTHYHLIPVAQYPSDSTDLPAYKQLVENISAPVISPSSQIAYGAFGGGEVSIPFFEWGLDRCDLGNQTNSVVHGEGYSYYYGRNYRVSCVEIYPLPEDEVVTVRIFQPDGQLYSESLYQTEMIQPEGISLIEGNRVITQQFTTHSVAVQIPVEFGVMNGIWRIEVEAGDNVIINRAYRLYSDDIHRISSICYQNRTMMWIANFSPQEQIDLIYIVPEIPMREGEMNYFEYYTYIERYRWTINISESSGVIAEFEDLVDDYSYFVVAEYGDIWQNYVPEYFMFGDAGIMALQARTSEECQSQTNAQEPIAIIFENNSGDIFENTLPIADVVSATLDLSPIMWFFQATAGDTITISIDAPDFDSILTLRDANGVQLVQDDDSGEGLNALISDFIIPEDGIYIIEVSSWNDKTGQYTLEVNR